MKSTDATLIGFVIAMAAMAVLSTFVLTHLSDDIQYTTNPTPTQFAEENSTITNITHDCLVSDYFYQSNHLDYCRQIGVHP